MCGVARLHKPRRCGEGELCPRLGCCWHSAQREEPFMNRIIYIIGLIVVVIAILSFLGLR